MTGNIHDTEISLGRQPFKTGVGWGGVGWGGVGGMGFEEQCFLLIITRRILDILLITYKALNGLAPPYITDLINIYVPRRNLRSSSSRRLVVPTYNLRSYGYRAFSCAAPVLWNALPQDIRLCETLNGFKSKLKTFLFRKAFHL